MSILGKGEEEDSPQIENATIEIASADASELDSSRASEDEPDLVALEPLESVDPTAPADEQAGERVEEPAEADVPGSVEAETETEDEAGAEETAAEEAPSEASAEPGSLVDAHDSPAQDADRAKASDDKKPDSKRGKHAAPEGAKGNSAHIGVVDDGAPGFVSAGFGEIPKEKRRRGMKAFGITVGVIAAVLLVAYIAGAVVFMGRMLPNTVIGESDVSLLADAEVAEQLDGIVDRYQLDVVGGGFSYHATGADIGLSIDAARIINSIHENLNAWAWPLLVMQARHDESDLLVVSFDHTPLKDAITEEVNKFNETATPPKNATITYDEKKSKFVIEPERVGTQLDSAAVFAVVVDAISNLEPKARIGEDELVQPTVFADDKKLVEAAELATGMVSADLTLLMDGKPVSEINGEMLSSFITIDENLQVIFREEEMNAWVADLAAGFNTVGTERSYTRADGKQITVPAGGVYGWEIDTDALMSAVLEGIKAGSAINIDVPCLETAAVYKGVGERDWGNRYIDVDLSEQHVRFYGADGAIIWEADCISGTPDGTHNTVPGTWYVNSKESPSKLIGYENGKKIYETSVTYWMPFEGNGIGFHDATWQPSFGDSMYANGYGSHGCVNLSYDAAQSLYGIVEVGDPVVVHF